MVSIGTCDVIDTETSLDHIWSTVARPVSPDAILFMAVTGRCNEAGAGMTQQVSVIPGEPMASPGAGADVGVEVVNTGSDPVPIATVTVSAQPGLTFRNNALYTWNVGPLQYPASLDPARTTLTAPDVPLNLQPGQVVQLFVNVTVASDTSPGTLDVSFKIGEPVLGEGRASVRVTS